MRSHTLIDEVPLVRIMLLLLQITAHDMLLMIEHPTGGASGTPELITDAEPHRATGKSD
jgi:hypothetical protein